MKLYHISTSPLKKGIKLSAGYKKIEPLVEPFLMALDKGPGAFETLLLQARYLRAVLRRSGLREWSDYAKWATEAAFEHVRRKKFNRCYSRLGSLFYYADMKDSRRLYEKDYLLPGDAAGVGVFEIEVQDERPQSFDMSIYDAAYKAMGKNHDLKLIRDCAREYYGGARTAAPVMEILSDKPATVIRKIRI